MQDTSVGPEAIRVEWVILADAAQMVGGKLYLLGGGWDTLWVNSRFPVEQRCGIAAAFKVPWNETNRRHDVELEIMDSDGASVLKAGAQLEVGRPPGIPPGHDQRAQIALDLTLRFQSQGTYVIVARAGGQETRSIFHVLPGPLLQLQQQLKEGKS